MSGLSGLAMGIWQDAAGASPQDVHVIMYCMVVIAAGVALVMVALLVSAIYGIKLMNDLKAMTARVVDQVTPITAKTNTLLADLGPKVQSVTANVEQMSYTVRAKVDELAVTVSELNTTVKEMNHKTRAQMTRVDGLVTEALTTTEHVSRNVQEGIRAPIRQISGIVAGVKVGLETLIERSPFSKRGPETGSPYDL